MKKLGLLALFIFPSLVWAQENVPPEVIPFWKDKTFLMLVGGAVFLIIVLIVKKILDRRNNIINDQEYNEKDYEDTNIAS